MFTHKATPRWFLVTLLVGAVLLSGCARTTPETKPPGAPQAGVIDMNKAVQYHPKYQDWQTLKQQAVTIEEQLAAAGNINTAASGQVLNMAGNMDAGLKAAGEQEFKIRMTAKQEELQAQLTEKANRMREELSAQFKAYAAELDKEYQPQIFNLQLKLQTVRMDEKEAEAVKQALDAVKAEQAAKLAAKEQELSASMEKTLAPEQAAMEQELAAYARQLNVDLANKMSAQAAALNAKLGQTSPETSSQTAAAGGLKQQLGMKQQEIKVLEEYIRNDVRDKAAKVAAERGLDTVLTGHIVNVNAVDVTEAVIAAFKK